MTGRSDEQAVQVGWRRERLSIHLEQVIAFGNVDPRSAQRRAQVGIPALTRINASDAIASVFDREIGAQQADVLGLLGVAIVPGAREIRMADGQLAASL